ncbi:hypothetical protein ON010_g5061 [Phytophthora cinnamomi]|nr:hypothetical protein ON010_g5061 [Phytophthora cinnamomi]
MCAHGDPANDAEDAGDDEKRSAATHFGGAAVTEHANAGADQDADNGADELRHLHGEVGQHRRQVRAQRSPLGRPGHVDRHARHRDREQQPDRRVRQRGLVTAAFFHGPGFGGVLQVVAFLNVCHLSSWNLEMWGRVDPRERIGE